MFGKMFLTTDFAWETALRRVALEVAAQVKALARAYRHRREVMRLCELDDRTLKDIGLTRLDVAGALSEPYHKDPSSILVIRSVERRVRERPAASESKSSDAFCRF